MPTGRTGAVWPGARKMTVSKPAAAVTAPAIAPEGRISGRRAGAIPADGGGDPDWIVSVGAVSNDPCYGNGSLWGMYGDRTSPVYQFGSQAGEAWAAGEGVGLERKKSKILMPSSRADGQRSSAFPAS